MTICPVCLGLRGFPELLTFCARMVTVPGAAGHSSHEGRCGQILWSRGDERGGQLELLLEEQELREGVLGEPGPWVSAKIPVPKLVRGHQSLGGQQWPRGPRDGDHPVF